MDPQACTVFRFRPELAEGRQSSKPMAEDDLQPSTSSLAGEGEGEVAVVLRCRCGKPSCPGVGPPTSPDCRRDWRYHPWPGGWEVEVCFMLRTWRSGDNPDLTYWDHTWWWWWFCDYDHRWKCTGPYLTGPRTQRSQNTVFSEHSVLKTQCSQNIGCVLHDTARELLKDFRKEPWGPGGLWGPTFF